MPDSARRRGADAPRPRDRAAAQGRADRIRAFRAELTALTHAGVGRLADEQLRQITQYHDELLSRLAAQYEVDRTEAAGRLSRGMQVASLLAAVALTAAIYSLVGRFWGRLELPLQATLLCAFPLMALVTVEVAAHRERTLYISSIFALVAYGTFWLAIFALGDLLNVPVTPSAIWAGALFGVALALPYGFRLVLGAALLALLAALSGSVFQGAGMPWTAAAEFPEIVTAAAFLMAILASRFSAIHPAFGAVTRLVACSVAFVGLLVLSSAGQASLLPTPHRVSEFIYQGVLLVTAVVTLVIAVRRRWTETIYVAAVTLTVFMFLRFVDWFWEGLPRYLFFFMLAALAFAWLWMLRRLRARRDVAEAL